MRNSKTVVLLVAALIILYVLTYANVVQGKMAVDAACEARLQAIKEGVPNTQQATGEPLANTQTMVTTTTEPDIGLPPPAFRDNTSSGIAVSDDGGPQDKSGEKPISSSKNTSVADMEFSPIIQRQIQLLRSQGFETVDTPTLILLQNQTHLYLAWANETNEHSMVIKK